MSETSITAYLDDFEAYEFGVTLKEIESSYNINITKSFVGKYRILPTLTVNPRVDASVKNSGTNITFSSLRNSFSTRTTDQDDGYVGITSDTPDYRYIDMQRGVIQFDTSSIPDTANITAARLYIYGGPKSNTFSTDPELCISEGTCGSTTTIVAADYNRNIDTEIGDRIAYTDYAENEYNCFTLNGTGLSYINKTGNTVIFIRTSWDLDNVAPITFPNPEPNKVAAFYFWTQESTTYDPMLEIEYDIPTPKDISSTYDIASVVTSTKSSLYDIADVVQKTISSLYDIIHVLVPKSIDSTYDIKTSKDFESLYDIRHSVNSSYYVSINPDFEPGEFTELKIRNKLNQLSAAQLKLINPATADLALVDINDQLNIEVNDMNRFTGYVTRKEREDKINVWQIVCEGAGRVLRDSTIDEETLYENDLLTTILDELLPAAWTRNVYNDGTKLTYKVTPAGSLLTNIDGICKMAGHDWYIDVDSSDNIQFNTIPQRRVILPVKEYVLYTDCAYLQRRKTSEKTVTSVLCVGNQPEVARDSSIFSMVVPKTKVSELDFHETYVTVPCTKTASTIYVEDTTSYPSSGSIQIGSEVIDYTSKSATYFSNCTRDSLNYHDYGEDVLSLSLLTISEAVLDDMAEYGGVLLVGSEKILYTVKSSNVTFEGLTRGYGSTTAYAHSYGAPVYDAQYTEAAPHVDSPVALYGVNRVNIDALGSVDKNGSDILAYQWCYKMCGEDEYGQFMALDTDFWADINLGDYITINDGEESFDAVIVGVDHDQFKPMTIYFGLPEEYIFDNVAKIDTTSTVSREKTDKNKFATILEISPSAKQVKAQKEDGTEVWVDIE